jgi:hypothetical protein
MVGPVQRSGTIVFASARGNASRCPVSERLCCKSILSILSRNIDSRSGANAQQRFKGARAPIRSLQISISQRLLGDFCNTIRTRAERTVSLQSSCFKRRKTNLNRFGHMARVPFPRQVRICPTSPRRRKRQISAHSGREDVCAMTASLRQPREPIPGTFVE